LNKKYKIQKQKIKPKPSGDGVASGRQEGEEEEVLFITSTSGPWSSSSRGWRNTTTQPNNQWFNTDMLC
jgi:hypothetical protein